MEWGGGQWLASKEEEFAQEVGSQNFLPRLARMRARVNVSPLWPAFSSTRTEITRAKNKFTPLVTPRRLGIMFGHCGRPARYHSLTICHFCRFVDKFQKYRYTCIWGSSLSNLFIRSRRQSRKKNIIFFNVFNRTERARIGQKEISEIFKAKIFKKERESNISTFYFQIYYS